VEGNPTCKKIFIEAIDSRPGNWCPGISRPITPFRERNRTGFSLKPTSAQTPPALLESSCGGVIWERQTLSPESERRSGLQPDE
jgi:hypothetical protein